MGKLSQDLRKRIKYGFLEGLSDEQGKLLGRFVRRRSMPSLKLLPEFDPGLQKAFCYAISQKVHDTDGLNVLKDTTNYFTHEIANYLSVGDVVGLSKIVKIMDKTFGEAYRKQQKASEYKEK